MPKTLRFPRDEQNHECSMEWWYFNGHLASANGRRYSYMNCLFKARARDFLPLLNRTKINPIKYVYFSHSIISDIKSGKSYPQVNFVSIVSKDSFTRPLLFINYTNPLCVSGYFNSSIEEPDKFLYKIKTENLELGLKSMKKPLLEGGSGFVNMKPEKTYYYSLSNMKTEGFVCIKGKKVAVKGKSWFDHQWANITNPNKWNWMSIQLENNMELVCFEYETPKNVTRMATISYPDNRQETFHNIVIEPSGRYWKSKKTKVSYPLEWKIMIPERKLFLKASPLMKNQEISFGVMHYWEGPLSISGTFGGKPVRGYGFLELVGRPKQSFNMKFLRSAVSRVTGIGKR